MKFYPLVKLCLALVCFICAKSVRMLIMELQAKKHSVRNVSFKVNSISYGVMSNGLDDLCIFIITHYFSNGFFLGIGTLLSTSVPFLHAVVQ